MPLEPIDLQVLFSRMPDVGKEQSTQNELVSGAQAAQASELVKETDVRSNSVNETKESDEVRHAGESEEGSAEKSKGQRKKKKTPRKSLAAFSDPDLGKNIDITG